MKQLIPGQFLKMGFRWKKIKLFFRLQDVIWVGHSFPVSYKGTVTVPLYTKCIFSVPYNPSEFSVKTKFIEEGKSNFWRTEVIISTNYNSSNPRDSN